MLVLLLLLGSLLLFGLLGGILYFISTRSKNPQRFSVHALKVILSISILVLIVQNYVYKTVPSNAILILILIVSLIAIGSPHVQHHNKNKK